MYRQHNAQPQRIEVQMHKVGITQLFETPFMAELIDQTKNYTNGNEVLAHVSRLAV